MPHRSERKIISFGRYSMGVILPPAWFRFYGLKRGDTVEVVSDGIIVIKPTNIKDMTPAFTPEAYSILHGFDLSKDRPTSARAKKALPAIPCESKHMEVR